MPEVKRAVVEPTTASGSAACRNGCNSPVAINLNTHDELLIVNNIDTYMLYWQWERTQSIGFVFGSGTSMITVRFGSVEVLSTFKKVPAWFEFCKCRVQDQFGSGSSSTELESGKMCLRWSSVTE